MADEQQSNMQATTRGNVTSVRVVPEGHPSDQQQAARPSEPSGKIGGKIVRYQAGTDTVTTLKTGTKRQPTSAPTPSPEQGVVVTGPMGSPISLAQATKFDKVNIPSLGGETSIAAALTMGYLRPRKDGGFELSNPTAEAAAVETKEAAEAQDKKDEAKDDGEVSLVGVEGTSAGTDIVHRQIREAAGDAVYGGLVHGLIAGKDTEAQVEEIARRSGQPVEHVREAVQGVYGEYHRSAQQIAAANGVPLRAYNAMVEWATEKMPDASLDALDNLVRNHDASGVARIAKQFQRTGQVDTAYSDSDILNASFGDGVSAVQTEKGVMLEIRGHGRMSFKAAVARGLVRWTSK